MFTTIRYIIDTNAYFSYTKTTTSSYQLTKKHWCGEVSQALVYNAWDPSLARPVMEFTTGHGGSIESKQRIC